MAIFLIVVNGHTERIDSEPDMPLLWVLRDKLHLFGTKYGCGVGVCGSCTVLEGKTAVRSCQITAQTADGKSFTTIEGLSPSGSHPCQRAWIDADVAQCGFCQPGMIMEACAFVNEHSHPTDADIDRVFSQHVCRCGTYSRMRTAIHQAAAATRK
ncbi:MAG: (2Fe-2S)-binding protein [Gemmatimonadaceae bacterium]